MFSHFICVSKILGEQSYTCIELGDRWKQFSLLEHKGIKYHPESLQWETFIAWSFLHCTFNSECSPLRSTCQGSFAACREEIKHLPSIRNQPPSLTPPPTAPSLTHRRQTHSHILLTLLLWPTKACKCIAGEQQGGDQLWGGTGRARGCVIIY